MANVNVTYDELLSVAGQIDSGKDQLGGILQTLQGQVDGLVASGFQTEQASQAYQTDFLDYVTNTKQAIDALEKYSTFLRTAAQTLQDTDSALAQQMRG